MRTLLALVAGIALGIGGLWLVLKPGDPLAPDVNSIAAASLNAVQAQNRLSVFAGRFTVAVTSRAERLGFSAEKTMIVPATVKYEIDYAKLGPDDIAWDPVTKEMIVDLPPIEISEPEIDMSRVREYGAGTVMLTVGGANEALDRANRAKVRGAVMKEAQAPIMLDMARQSAREAAARSFRLPLQAAGVPATVTVRFPDEAGSAM